MIEFIFLDLDDTILDFHRAEAVAIRKTLHALNVEPTDEVVARYSEINDRHWKALERGELTREQVKLGRFHVLFEELGVGISASVAKSLYEKNLSMGHFFVDGAPKLLMTLAARYPLYLASNGTLSVQQKRIESAGIARYFKGIFISEELGVNKPDKAFFDLCAAQIPGFDPASAVILGDSLSSDVQGGINACIHTCWFNPNGKTCGDIQPEFEISALSQFASVLEHLNGKKA